ncbi:MAG: outer membrane beta-barrel family protein [Dysgonamonadaceae bacterium]|nr:outer membrane beta-barrel family protein [Dysgonamonadaceae bacterium]MDD4399946.1 outer membrane beta-barrel family protein [Dysgonamonadaceae bacterium]
MRIKFLFILVILFIQLGTLQAQTITGIVNDEQSQPVEFANVVLYSLPDSSMISGAVTDGMGLFALKTNQTAENTYLQISFMGYRTQIAPTMSHQTIVLKSESTELGEVVVKGTLPVIRIKNDALVTTVQNSILSKAGTGIDVLKRLPSLTYKDGVFSVFGKGEAKIYINNREMRDITELDNLSSADIRDVEIINNPGARYDASIKAVIRISTIRKEGDGFSFDVRSSYYKSQRTNLYEQLNLNYRKKGWDIFGTFDYGLSQWFQDSKMWQKTFVDTLWTQDNTLFIEGNSKSLTGITGFNYEITPKQYVGIKYTITSFPPNKSVSSMSSTVLADGKLYDKWSSQEESSYNNNPSHRFNAYYNGDFGKLKIDFNTDLYANKQSKRSHVTETSQEYDNRTVNSENNVSNRLIASKLVLTYPVFSGNLSFGSEYTNTHRTDDYVSEEKFVPSSNTTIHDQNNALFAEYSILTPVGQLGAGLRYEKVCSDYFSNDVKVEEQSRHYNQWFPNISFGTRLKDVSMQLSYTAKTKRPTYWQLSNNVFYGNRFTLQTGNPFLQPTITHDITLVGVWKFVQVMSSYKNEKDAIIYWTEQMEENPAVSVVAYRNLEKLPSLTTLVTLSPKFGIWSPQLTGGFIKQRLTIMSHDTPITLNKPLFFGSFNNSFQLPKGFALTVDSRFQRNGNYQNVYVTENQFIVNAGITKSFFDERLGIQIKGEDIFYGLRDGNLLYNSKMELWQKNRYDTRKFEFTVRYKFNAARSKYKGTGAGDSEIGRF